MRESEFNAKIQTVTCREELFRLKESIKNEVVHPNIRWDERMILYRQVRIINERIDALTRSEQPTTV